jgi:YidC/Oxa1 family membrane protein insertase
MTDIRRTLLWGIFIASLFFIWESWSRHNGQPSLFGPPPARVAAPAATPAPPPVTGSVAAAPVPAPAPASAPVASQQIAVSTDLMNATFDTAGGDLVRVELLRHQEAIEKAWYEPFLAWFGASKAPLAKKDVVLLDRSPERYYVAQTGLWPSPAGPGQLPEHHTLMTPVVGERTLKPGANELQVKFESPVSGGVKLVKTYTFNRGDYTIGVRHDIVNESGAPISPLLYYQLVRDGNPPPGGSSLYFTFTGPAVYTDTNHYKKIDFSAIEKREGDKVERVTAASGWVAMVQHYFLSAWLLDTPAAAAPPRQFFTGKLGNNTYSVGMLVPTGTIAPNASHSVDARLYVGPQEEDKLAALAPGLELVKDYGWFTILAKPLFWLLTQLHKLIGNWGWSIVGLVVLLKIAFFWLNAKAYGSMAKMKAINPRIMEMRERLKDKPQQMQQEMMRIYREEKVNPLGGCLPIFVQMPFFIALYWVLLSTVEMRNAPWIGWITDLSAKDPYFILPLLMTGTSLLQTWLNPTPPDPVQARMMWIMPLVFSVMFFFFPAGLVLYWLTNNILSIAQQYLINKRLGVLGK